MSKGTGGLDAGTGADHQNAGAGRRKPSRPEMPARLTPAAWFGKHVAFERARRGWSMRDLCAKADIAMSPSTIARIESGCEVWLSIATRVAHALGLSLDHAVQPPRCGQCYDAPPPGFTCQACGTERGAGA